MATTRSFQDMLNDYLPNDLLKEEFVKRDYLLTKIEKDDGWLTGPLIVPFRGAGASSVAFGSLTAASDVAEDTYVRGEVSSAKEVWGTMLFNHRDIMEHGKVSDQNFLKVLPDTIEDFITYMKSVVSTNLLNGAHFAQTTAASSANDGVVTVDRIDRFVIGQKVQYVVTDASTVTSYVKTINVNANTAVLVTTRGGATVVNFSAGGKDLASAAKVYNDGAFSNSFSSLRGALLSSANGGDASLYGQTKTAYPYLQAINIDGSGAAGGLAITAANIVGKCFEALITVAQKGKGKPTDILMSYKNFGSVVAAIESSKGAFNVVAGSQKASQYGWMEIQVGSLKGMLNFVAVQEADDDVIMLIDWRGIKFHSNGFFQKRKSPEGNEFFEVRATTGYQYLVDVCLFGEFVVTRPSYSGIIYSISY